MTTELSDKTSRRPLDTSNILSITNLLITALILAGSVFAFLLKVSIDSTKGTISSNEKLLDRHDANIHQLMRDIDEIKQIVKSDMRFSSGNIEKLDKKIELLNETVNKLHTK